MPPIITFAGQKGGVGKSTTALALAVEWHRRGVRVLLVDADDEQRTALTWSDVAVEAGRSVPMVVHMGDALRTQLPPLAAAYELVIIDTPGRNGRRATYALSLSDLAILPCGPTGPDVWAMSAALDQVRDVQAVQPGLDAAIMITRKQPGTVIGHRARAALEAAECDVLDTELHYLVAFGEAVTAGQGPTTYEPSGRAADEIRNLALEVGRRLEARGVWAPPAPEPRRRMRTARANRTTTARKEKPIHA